MRARARSRSPASPSARRRRAPRRGRGRSRRPRAPRRAARSRPPCRGPRHSDQPPGAGPVEADRDLVGRDVRAVGGGQHAPAPRASPGVVPSAPVGRGGAGHRRRRRPGSSCPCRRRRRRVTVERLAGSASCGATQRQLVGVRVGRQRPEHFVPLVQLDRFAADLLGFLWLTLRYQESFLRRLRLADAAQPEAEFVEEVVGDRAAAAAPASTSTPGSARRARSRPFTVHRLAAAAGAAAEAGRLRAGLDRGRLGADELFGAAPCRRCRPRAGSTRGPLAAASAAVESNKSRASAHAATSRNGTSLGI